MLAVLEGRKRDSCVGKNALGFDKRFCLSVLSCDLLTSVDCPTLQKVRIHNHFTKKENQTL